MAEASDRAEGRERATTGEEITPADVAEAVVAAVAKGRDHVLVGRTARRAWIVNRLAPTLYERLMKRRLRAGGGDGVTGGITDVVTGDVTGGVTGGDGVTGGVTGGDTDGDTRATGGRP